MESRRNESLTQESLLLQPRTEQDCSFGPLSSALSAGRYSFAAFAHLVAGRGIAFLFVGKKTQEPAAVGELISWYKWPVSYTHLDVYKRQQ